MSRPIYMDEHVSRAITEGLRLRGIDVLTVQEDGRAGIPDHEVLDRATELGRLLFTQDDDLLAEANRRQKEGRSFGGLVSISYRFDTVEDLTAGLDGLAGLDEVPGAYRDIDQVMAAQADLVEPPARFFPRIVKMAPAGERPED